MKGRSLLEAYCEKTEVTPEMLAAGRSVLVGWNPEFDSPEWCVEALYEAMEDARECNRAAHPHTP